MIEYDVLIIGAGPGGSMAARYAAKNGMKVLVVEKRSDIGCPVRCGEGLSKNWADKIGIQPGSKCIANEVIGAKIISPDEKSEVILDAEKAGAEVGYVIDRDKFDKYLAGKAADEGAEIWMKSPAMKLIKENDKIVGAVVRKLGQNIDVKAKIILGADGFESQIGRWAGINTALKEKDMVTCIQYRLAGVDVDSQYNSFYIGSSSPAGYIWVFPKSRNEANVGIGISLNIVKKPGDVKKYLDEFIEKHPELNKGTPIQIVSGGVSACKPLKSVTLDNFMLIGDSARMIDPITGGGIGTACMSGRYAGEVAAEAIKSGDTSKEFLQKYEKLWRDDFETKLLRNWYVKEKFVQLDDDILNKLMDAISSVKMEEISILSILKAVQEKYPSLVEELEDFI